MNSRHTLPFALVLGLSLITGTAFAQSAPASAAKKELVAKLVKLQQPGVEALARTLTLQPAARMQQQAGAVIQARVAPEKREALIKELDADFKKYADEAVPLARDRAIKLAPSTMGKVLEEQLSEDELRQVIAIVESPVYAKYIQLGGEQQKALSEKLAAELRPTIEAKLKTLDQSLAKRLGAAVGAPAPAGAPAGK
jgi:hypothetical protein